MDGTSQQTAYRDAFEHAKARLDQLARELQALENRHAALLHATKILEPIIGQHAEQRHTSIQNSSAVESNYPVAVSDGDVDWAWKQPVTKTYVHHGDSANEIERRIDLAIGR